MTYIIYKTVKPSYLKKMQIILNINILMFQVIFFFVFFESIFMKQMIVFSAPFCC